ncbi:MAG: hypothetical protein COV66_10710 [Nitrospinae bacterium CG11_big_fil_rev_8_21_14_0_20_45_15]|nr:MAG: hypothetical protein COV66_10710 [Nitrospinae bacterium CG11_big_fil_rev_8_21_14_0_20_45_15]
MSKYDYKDKTVLITGASRGLGREMCLEFSRRGARLALCSRNEKLLGALVDEVRQSGGVVIAKALDCTKPEEAQDWLEWVLAEFGRIDVLVNNVGTATPVPFSSLETSLIEEEIRINYLAPVHLLRLALPLMKKKGRGQIINVTSLSAILPFPFLTSYSASKAALAAFGTALRTETLGEGIDVINVFPGKMDTGFHQDQMEGGGTNKNISGSGLAPEIAAKRIINATGKRRTTVYTELSGRIIGLFHPLCAFILESMLHRAKIK